jgi:hypothetical protein
MNFREEENTLLLEELNAQFGFLGFLLQWSHDRSPRVLAVEEMEKASRRGYL